MGSDKATASSSSQPIGRRSRVRTGCLTCRSRKVKCDEARPFCYNCTRLNKACLYQSPLLSDFCANGPRPAGQIQSLSRGEWHPGNDQIGSAVPFVDSVGQHLSGNQDLLPGTPWFNPDLDIESASLDFVTGEWGDLFPSTSDHFHIPIASQRGTPSSAASLPDNIPLVEGSSSSYFLSEVEPPFITPWDLSNWNIVKSHIPNLQKSVPAVGAAVIAVEVLYKSMHNGEDTATALSKYFVAKSAHLTLLKDETSELDTILIVTLLLCCFEVVAQHETVSSTLKQKDLFITRLEKRPKSQRWSPISSRIICWLHLYHTKAMHLGGRGVLSPKLLELLPEQQPLLSLISLQQSPISHADTVLYDLRESLFQFYCELQRTSTSVSGLNRHHRPRGGPEDEENVEELSKEIEERLKFIFEGRPYILSTADEDANGFTSSMSIDLEQVVMLAKLCKTSYYAEIVYHARGSGMFEFGSTRINEARAVIRDLISQTMSRRPEVELSPAFMWPLFLYIVESTDSDEADWGLGILSQLSDSLWNASSVKELVSGLAKEQITRGARVDSRYFSIEKFGAVPPFM